MSKSPKPIDRSGLIRELAQLLDETGLTEIEIEQDGKRVRVARRGSDARPCPLRRGARAKSRRSPEREAAVSRSIREASRRRDLADGRHRLSPRRSPAASLSSISAARSKPATRC